MLAPARVDVALAGAGVGGEAVEGAGFACRSGEPLAAEALGQDADAVAAAKGTALIHGSGFGVGGGG